MKFKFSIYTNRQVDPITISVSTGCVTTSEYVNKQALERLRTTIDQAIVYLENDPVMAWWEVEV